MPGTPVPPFDLAAGERKTIHVLLHHYEAHLQADSVFTRKLPFLKKKRPANTCVWIEIVGSRTKFAKIEKPLEKFLATGKVEKGAAQFNSLTAESN